MTAIDKNWQCAARKQSLPGPADCDWPFCSCDAHAGKVFAAISESGFALIRADAVGADFDPVVKLINIATDKISREHSLARGQALTLVMDIGTELDRVLKHLFEQRSSPESADQ